MIHLTGALSKRGWYGHWMTIAITVDRIRRSLAGFLTEGAQSSTNLAKRASKLLAADIDSETVELILEQTSNCWEVGEDGFINPQIAFDGVTFTHRVTAAEVSEGSLVAMPDFVIAFDLAMANIEADLSVKYNAGTLPNVDADDLSWLEQLAPQMPQLEPADLIWSDHGNPFGANAANAANAGENDDFVSSGSVENESLTTGSLDAKVAAGHRIYGPEGWLENLEGRLLGFTRQDGKWCLTGPIIEPRNEKADRALEALLVTALHAVIEHGEIGELDNEFARELVGELPLGKKPSVLSAGVARPLTELFAKEGISHRDGFLGSIETDWEAEAEREDDQRFARTLGVGLDEVRAVKALSTAAIVRSLQKFLEADDHATFSSELSRDELGEILDDLTRGRTAPLESDADLLRALAVPGVAEAIAPRIAMFGGPARESAWLELFEDLQPYAQGMSRASIFYLLARINPNPETTDGLLAAALKLRSNYPAVFDEQIWINACRLDQPRLEDSFDSWIQSNGLAKQIQRMDFQADPQTILRMAVQYAPKVQVRNTLSVGRNDDCPCGSGKKFKKCHLGQTLPTPEISLGKAQEPPRGSGKSESQGPDLRGLVTRVQALQLLHLDRTQPRLVSAVVRSITGQNLDNAAPGLFSDTLNGVMTVALDTATCSESSTESFLQAAHQAGAASRWPGELFELVRSWTNTRMSVFEVTDRAIGVQLTIRDLRSGERFIVSAPETSRNFPIDSLLLSRVIFNSRAFQFAFGALPVPDRDRDATLAMIDALEGELSPTDVGQWVSGMIGRFGTPAISGHRVQSNDPIDLLRDIESDDRFRNTDSHVVAYHRAMVHAARADGQSVSLQELRETLDAMESLQTGAAADTWDYMCADDQNQFLRGTIELVRASGGKTKSGDSEHLLLVQTNSATRYSDLCAMLGKAFGSINSVWETVDSQADEQLAAELGLDSSSLVPKGIEDQPEITPEIAEQIRNQLNQRWLKEHIPALGGLTPYEAANDPTRREDLRKLLQSFVTSNKQSTASLPPELGSLFQMDPYWLASELGIKLR
jgi:SEC-C motif